MNMDSIELLILDVDGVLTDGLIVTGPEGERIKRFYVQDGCAIKLWQRCGLEVALLSGRGGEVVERRAAELGIEWVRTGVSDKSEAYESILSEGTRSDSAVAYVGDDLPDLGPMARCGFPVAVANAVPAVKRASAYVTRRAGGRGAVAEVIELLLRKQKKWSLGMLTEI
jgi:3-deoxy-D-manno-octulosonate 8-phosphate phosphatase (KDO 8-P phosphatase)